MPPRGSEPLLDHAQRHRRVESCGTTSGHHDGVVGGSAGDLPEVAFGVAGVCVAAFEEGLIGQIVAEANTKEARAEMKEHRGPTPQAAVESVLHDLEPAAAALRKLPPDEAAQVAAWFVAIAEAVAQSAKTVNADEQATIEK